MDCFRRRRGSSSPYSLTRVKCVSTRRYYRVFFYVHRPPTPTPTPLLPTNVNIPHTHTSNPRPPSPSDCQSSSLHRGDWCKLVGRHLLRCKSNKRFLIISLCSWKVSRTSLKDSLTSGSTGGRTRHDRHTMLLITLNKMFETSKCTVNHKWFGRRL